MKTKRFLRKYGMIVLIMAALVLGIVPAMAGSVGSVNYAVWEGTNLSRLTPGAIIHYDSGVKFVSEEDRTNWQFELNIGDIYRTNYFGEEIIPQERKYDIYRAIDGNGREGLLAVFVNASVAENLYTGQPEDVNTLNADILMYGNLSITKVSEESCEFLDRRCRQDGKFFFRTHTNGNEGNNPFGVFYPLEGE